MDAAPTSHDDLIRSYGSLRKAIGVIGIALPFVVAIGACLLQQLALRSSVSQYYHTGMRDVFVGSLCAIAVFLWFYQGHERRDGIAGNLASLFALGVALFPTAPAAHAMPMEKTIGAVHLVSAALFFCTLAYFSLALFRLSDRVRPTRRKLERNRVYTVCGYAILACLVLMALLKLVPKGSPLWGIRPIFWLEALAIVSFGVSWLVKSEAILKDEEGAADDLAGERTAPRIPRGSYPAQEGAGGS